MNYKLEKNELENKVTITFNFSQEEFEQAIKNTNKEDRNQAIQEAVDSLISSNDEQLQFDSTSSIKNETL